MRSRRARRHSEKLLPGKSWHNPLLPRNADVPAVGRAESNIKHCPSKKTEGVKGLWADFSLGEREYGFSQARRLDHGLLGRVSLAGQRLSHGKKFRRGCLVTDT